LPEPRRLRIGGRLALFVGAALLLLSFSYPWLRISGDQPQVPAQNYGVFDLVTLASNLTGIPLAWPLYFWLFLVAAGAFVASVVGRRARNLGTSAVLVIALLGILAFLASLVANNQNPSASSSVAADWGIVLAIGASITVEVGMRLTKPARVVAPRHAPVVPQLR
jgi:uncharacterized membrane protein YhaH (DUF805 family)